MPAFAEFRGSKCTNVVSQDFGQVFLESGVSCDTAEKIQRELTDIKSFAGHESPLTLFVQWKSYNSFGTYGRLVVLNYQQLAWGGIRPQSQNERIWAHEIGHTFFSTWLARDFKAIQGFRDYMSASGESQVQRKDPNYDTSKELALKWKSDFGKVRDIQVPYNELFADLVGVLYANDVMAMTKAMVAPGMPDSERTKAGYYAFAGKYDLSTWDQSEVHFYFAPARAYIGERFLKFPIDDKQKAVILQKVYQACLFEIEKYWSLSKVLPSSAEANASLILALSKAD
jgi:hypothetical protein